MSGSLANQELVKTMHKMKLSKTHSYIFDNSPAPNPHTQLAYRPFGSQLQKASVAPKTQTDIDNEAFAHQQMEATGLSIQAKYGTITPEGQERLTVLQAKMDGLLDSRLEHATRFGHNFANIPLRRPDTPTPIQAKLTIGEPGDKYEQEADETARQVVQRIHQPQSEKLQRESLPEDDELQMKPERGIQREALPEDDELQMKPERGIQREALPEDDELQMKPMVQRASDGGIAATPDLETSIQQARGSGQPLADSIKSPMEQTFGADFSGVKVHTDTQADHLNQSIQAKAFTTGQDVFFRSGAYEPGSRGGQELLAHELTHVVQQSGGTIASSASNLLQRANTVVDDATDPQNTIAPGSGKGLLQDSTGRVQPDVQFGPLINDCGTYMHAIIHPQDDKAGTAPQPGTWPTWWTTANKPSNSNFWVRGHLLNHNLGGPGDDKRNLTPITKKANSAHLHLVETAAKTASRQGWGLDYTVEAKYDNVGPTQLRGDNTDPNSIVWPYLTTGLLCQVKYIVMKSGKVYHDQPEFIENKH